MSPSINNDYVAAQLVNYLVSAGYRFDTTAIDWLDLCCNIESIEVSPGKYTDDDLFCEIAWYAELARSKVLSSFVFQLMRFQFSWGALESITRELVNSAKIERFGTINALCGHLCNSRVPTDIIHQYKPVLDAFIERILQIKQFEPSMNRLGLSRTNNRVQKDYINELGQGIFIVYQVRNHFAHGSMSLPFPIDPEDDNTETIDNSLIEMATTIVLMTIAMLLYIDVGEDDFVLSEFPFPEENTITAKEYLSTLFTA